LLEFNNIENKITCVIVAEYFLSFLVGMRVGFDRPSQCMVTFHLASQPSYGVSVVLPNKYLFADLHLPWLSPLKDVVFLSYLPTKITNKMFTSLLINVVMIITRNKITKPN
jgi:hypothetical protein